MSFQTVHAVVLVATVPVSVEQPLRTNSSIVPSSNRILNSPESVGCCCGLYLGDSVCSYLNINAAKNHHDRDSNHGVSANRREKERDHAPSSSSLCLRKYQMAPAATMMTRHTTAVPLMADSMSPPSFMIGMTS